MNPHSDGYQLAFPGMSWRFGHSGDPDRDHWASSGLVADVLAAFTPLLRPLSTDIILFAYRSETLESISLRQPFWFIVDSTAEAELALAPSAEKSSHRRIGEITPDSIESEIGKAFATEELGPDAVGVWKEIRVYAAEICLPALLSDRSVLELEQPGGAFGVDVHHRKDGAWVRGAFHQSTLPLQLTLTGQFPELRITTYWSIWAPGGSGERDLNAVIEALAARGWTRLPDGDV